MGDAALQAALDFTDDDLVANRAGRLSPTQQAKMTKKKGQSQVINLVFGAVFVIILVIIAAYVLPTYLSASDAGSSSAPPTGIIVAVLVVVAAIIAFTVWNSRRRLARLNGAVFMTEGEASGRQGMAPVADAAVMPVYRLSIGKVTFALATPEPIRAITNGAQYRGYYVKGTLPILVSAEKL